MSGSLAGKAALITGSTQGIGLAIARRLAACGCHIVLNGFGDAAGIAALRDGLARDAGVRVRHSTADLRNPGEVAQMMSEAARDVGAVDILINNAVVRHEAPIDAFPADAWDESVAVNLSAAFHTIRLAVPAMRQRRWGRIVNVSSIYGLRGGANRVGYVTTKTALIGLTRAVALDTVADGITCNAICPGTTETPVHEATVQGVMAATGILREGAERAVLAGKQPTARFVSADGVAALVEWLCGTEAADVTGAAIPVDGGWSVS